MNRTLYHRMIHDTVHGSFYLHKLLWQVIDTPEFQRLRNIRQTGNTHFVYDGSNHTRFEHSIGVAHLCRVFAHKLRQNSGHDIISDRQILLLQLAGLTHDIGHCAFSHLFDGKILPYFDPDAHFHHEQASYMILKRIYYKLEPEFNHYSIKLEDIKKVGRLILGSPEKVPESLREELVWTAEDRQHRFMYQILANEVDGIDVDKFDYIKRDCHNTGIVTGFDPHRLMEFAYIDVSDNYSLKYLPKAKELIREMWEARAQLHRRVYQHRVVKCFDEMILDIFKLVGTEVVLTTSQGNRVPLAQIHHDLDAYLLVTDHILSHIRLMPVNNEKVAEAKRLLNLIDNRRNWPTIFSAVLTDTSMLPNNYIRNLIDAQAVAVCECHVADETIYYFFSKGELQAQDLNQLRQLYQLLNGHPNCTSLKLKLDLLAA